MFLWIEIEIGLQVRLRFYEFGLVDTETAHEGSKWIQWMDDLEWRRSIVVWQKLIQFQNKLEVFLLLILLVWCLWNPFFEFEVNVLMWWNRKMSSSTKSSAFHLPRRLQNLKQPSVH